MKNLIKNNITKFVCFKDGDNNGDKLFLELWENSKNSIMKFETMQTYNVGEPSYDFFINSDFNGLVDDLISYWNEEKKGLYRKIYDKKIDFYRLHVIESPLSDYLKSEYYSYVASEFLGEKIKVIYKDNIDKADNIELYDFILFDDDAVFITLYNENFEPIEDWVTTDKILVKQLKKLFIKLFNQGINYRNMYKGIGTIEKNILDGLKV